MEVTLTKNNLGPKSDPKLRFFCHFLKVSLLVFLEITYDDSLQQFLTSIGGNAHEKKKIGGGGAKFWPNGPLLGPFSQVWFISFLGELKSSRVRISKKRSVAQIRA